MPLRMRRLSSQIFAANVVILLVTTALGFVLLGQSARTRLDHEFEMRAATIALAVSAMPEIRSCMTVEAPGCAALVERLANETAARTGASYVVIIDMNRVRHSHPYAALVGQKVSEPIVTIDGQVHTGINNGNTGRSANGKAPLYGTNGQMVGEVSAGIRESSVSAALWQVLPSYAAWLLVALAVGALASWLLARRLKRRTFGLELDEIVKLLQEREATLHGIREGVIAFDNEGRVSLINDEAQRLLGLGAVSGSRLADVMTPGPLFATLTSSENSPDEVVYTDDLCLVINRMPVVIGSERQGSVVTLRNETEITALANQLTGERSLTESMRAQQHEFANSMHVVAGLLELGNVDDALDYLLEVRGSAAEFDLTLRERIRAPHLIGLLLGKVAEADERGIELIIDPRSDVGESPRGARVLVTIIGNLLDNAFDAVAGQPPPRRVTLVVVDDGEVHIVVSDNGPGVAPGMVQRIFEHGVTTKPRERGGGTGLALVQRLVTRRHGTIHVDPGPGARFEVRLPAPDAASPGVPGE